MSPLLTKLSWIPLKVYRILCLPCHSYKMHERTQIHLFCHCIFAGVCFGGRSVHGNLLVFHGFHQTLLPADTEYKNVLQIYFMGFQNFGNMFTIVLESFVAGYLSCCSVRCGASLRDVNFPSFFVPLLLTSQSIFWEESLIAKTCFQVSILLQIAFCVKIWLYKHRCSFLISEDPLGRKRSNITEEVEGVALEKLKKP